MANTIYRFLIFPVVVILHFLTCINVASAFSCFLRRGGTSDTVRHYKTTELLKLYSPQQRQTGVRHHSLWKDVQNHHTEESFVSGPTLLEKAHTLAIAIFLISTTAFLSTVPATNAASSNDGASKAENAKITTGGASTLQSGRTISITRGVNLDGSDFSNQNLKGVAFQQSIVRDAKFTNSNLVGSSFFDATLDGSDFENSGR
jgi:hypothetical protein